MTHENIPEDIYKKHVLELYKSPSNFGSLENPEFEATEYNSVCGDEITIQLNLENEKVKEVKFSGSGCAISMVSASLLTEKIKGMSPREIKKISKKDIFEDLKMKITSSRMKCALLPLEATKKSLK